MEIRHARNERLTAVMASALVCLICLCFAAEAHAQQLQVQIAPSDAAPPPLRLVPAEARTELSSERDARARARRSFALAETHLASAEQMTRTDNFEGACAELGVYTAIVEDAFRSLTASGQEQGRLRDTYRRMELALRSQGSRLEAIRRAMPVAHAEHIGETMDCAQRSRTAALNAFFGGNVLREASESSQTAGTQNSFTAPQRAPNQ